MAAQTIVVTGANGFVGAHVAERAAEAGHTVWAVARESRPAPALAPYCSSYISSDLAEEWSVPSGADAVIHLAGLAAVGASFDAPQRYLTVNSAIMTNLGESLLRSGDTARVIAVSSGAVYAAPTLGVPNGELSPTRASSPYVVSKLLVELQAEYYAARGVDVAVARPFNHIGPGQRAGFLVPDLYDALHAHDEGAPLVVGNLDAERDYTDVRDVAAAYLTLAQAPTLESPIYNVASGRSVSGRQILTQLCAVLDREMPELVVDRSRLRPNDPPQIVGSSSLLSDELGWQPAIDWKQSIVDFASDRRSASA